MTDVVPVNHYGGDRHACLFPDFNSVQGLDERGNVALCECLHSLNHQLLTPGGRAWICLQMKPSTAYCPASWQSTRFERKLPSRPVKKTSGRARTYSSIPTSLPKQWTLF